MKSSSLFRRIANESAALLSLQKKPYLHSISKMGVLTEMFCTKITNRLSQQLDNALKMSRNRKKIISTQKIVVAVTVSIRTKYFELFFCVASLRAIKLIMWTNKNLWLWTWLTLKCVNCDRKVYETQLNGFFAKRL